MRALEKTKLDRMSVMEPVSVAESKQEFEASMEIGVETTSRPTQPARG